MAKMAGEAMKADRDRAIKQALKAKVPIFDVAAEFELSEAEIGEIIKSQGPPRRDDIIDARDVATGRGVNRGR